MRRTYIAASVLILSVPILVGAASAFAPGSPVDAKLRAELPGLHALHAAWSLAEDAVVCYERIETGMKAARTGERTKAQLCLSSVAFWLQTETQATRTAQAEGVVQEYVEAHKSSALGWVGGAFLEVLAKERPAMQRMAREALGVMDANEAATDLELRTALDAWARGDE